MVSQQKLTIKDKEYNIIAAEQEFIIHPVALGLLPVDNSSISCDFSASFYLDGYNLYLEKISLKSDNTNKEYQANNCRIYFTGSILIASDMVKEYHIDEGSPACFSYQTSKELIFDNGVLVTSIDQSRAMHRIRKNLQLGLRSLGSSKDLKCIKRFLNSAFVGDYKPFKLAYNRHKYIKKMKNLYDKEKPVLIML